MNLSPTQLEEYEEDLIAFCDGELDRLGPISGRDVLYAGGAAPLWLEGLAGRIGREGSLTALEADAERLAAARGSLIPPAPEDDEAVVRLVAGDVFDPPFVRGSFDLVYSAGLLHELDVSERSAALALGRLSELARPNGRLATADFVDDFPALQLEDEALEAELAALFGARLYGIGAAGRLVALHRQCLDEVRYSVAKPVRLRNIEYLLQGDDFSRRAWEAGGSEGLLARRAAFLRRALGEGYTRPATVYIEGAPPTALPSALPSALY